MAAATVEYHPPGAAPSSSVCKVISGLFWEEDATRQTWSAYFSSFFPEESAPSPPRVGRKSSYLARLAISSELRSLHAARRTAFDPDHCAAHAQLLRSIWAALRYRRWDSNPNPAAHDFD